VNILVDVSLEENSLNAGTVGLATFRWITMSLWMAGGPRGRVWESYSFGNHGHANRPRIFTHSSL
jgi:hypothetical protein